MHYQVYYYSARTREAAWSKPENARIVCQAEWEAFQTSQAQAQGGVVPALSGGPTTAAQAAVAQGSFLFIFISLLGAKCNIFIFGFTV